MMDDKQDIREGFIRQRRNLILGSLALLFSQLSGLTINEINILGNSLALDQPLALDITLSILVVYWFFRFLQYKNELGDLGIRERYDGYLKYALQKKALKKIEGNKVEFFGSNYNSDEKLTMFGNVSIAQKADNSVLIKGELHARLNGQNKSYLDVPVEFRNSELWIPKFSAHINVALHTKGFTEYILPTYLFILVSTSQIWIFLKLWFQNI